MSEAPTAARIRMEALAPHLHEAAQQWAQRLGLARPIFVSLGDVIVDWNAPTSDGYRAMFDAPNV